MHSAFRIPQYTRDLSPTMADNMCAFAAKRVERGPTPSLSALSKHDTKSSFDDDTHMISPRLACFLHVLLKDAATVVNVVVDNIRGLPKEYASSYMPQHPSQRFSDSSVPELCRHRWGAETCSGEDHIRRLASLTENTCSESSEMDSSMNRAPLAPRRRCSIESMEDIGDDMSISDSDDEDEFCTQGCSDDDFEGGDGKQDHQIRPKTSTRLYGRHEALKEIVLSELDDRDTLRAKGKSSSENSNKCLRSPPKAPERRASLRPLLCKEDVLPTNLSIPSKDDLDTFDIQKVHHRRYGFALLASNDPLTSLLASSCERGNQPTLNKETSSLILEKMYREVCSTAKDFAVDDDDETEQQDDSTIGGDDVMGELSTSSQHRMESRFERDCLPSCAKRRPSPQLDKGSFHQSCESTDVSPVRAKRRPSPELEAFSSLVDALATVKKQ